ncbi:MAG: barstar family protein [Anaerolineales bacterium]|nr:barstar family protein [Anaerolineales bacterium]
MKAIDAIAGGAAPAGVYVLTSRAKVDSVRDAVEEQGWRFFHLDGTTIQDKLSFLAATRAALELPSYTGHNWDAFEETINELSWAPAPGYVVLYDNAANFAEAQPEQWDTALSILQAASANWAAAGTPMVVLLRNAGRSVPDLPRI